MTPENPIHNVFISYSSKNKNVADAIVADLEQHGVKCWYAPRDVQPGDEWAAAIKNAIQQTSIFVLVYTEDSNRSHQVTNEVTLAVNAGKTVIPFRLSSSDMNDTLVYYLSSVHWLDAIDPPLNRNIEILREKITSILLIDGQIDGYASGALSEGLAAVSASSVKTAPASAPAQESGSGSPGKSSGKGPLIGIAAAVVVACIAGFALFGGKSSKTEQAAVQQSGQEAGQADANQVAEVETNQATAVETNQEAAAGTPAAETPATETPAAEPSAAEAQQTSTPEAQEAPTQETQQAPTPEVQQTTVAEAPPAEPTIAAPSTDAVEQELIPDQVLIPDNALFYNGHHYYIYNDVKTTWKDAQENCKERGGYLAVINDSKENEKLYKYMVTMGYDQAFFGLLFDSAKDDWDYQYGDNSDFRDWGVNSVGVQEPNNSGGGENHTQFDVNMSKGHWNDAKFGAVVRTPEGDKYKNRFTYICEWDQ